MGIAKVLINKKLQSETKSWRQTRKKGAHLWLNSIPLYYGWSPGCFYKPPKLIKTHADAVLKQRRSCCKIYTQTACARNTWSKRATDNQTLVVLSLTPFVENSAFAFGALQLKPNSSNFAQSTRSVSQSPASIASLARFVNTLRQNIITR